MPASPLEQLVSSLRDDDGLLSAVTDEVRGGVPALADLPADEVRAHVRALLAAGLTAAAEGRPAAPEELDLAAALAVTRAEQGVPVVTLLAGLHVGHQHVWCRARELASTLGVGPEIVLDAMQQHGEWSESIRAATIEAHRRTEVSRASSRADRQTALVNSLVVHGAGPSELEALHALGLDAGALWLRRERHRPGEDARPGSRGGDVAARVGPDVVALLARADPPVEDRLAALVGPFPADQAPAQHALAGLLLTTAEATGQTGTVTVQELAVDLAVASLPSAGPALAAALLPGLAHGDAARTLVETLAAWLEHGQRLDATSRVLFVHPNTVRHRLGRLRAAGVTVDVHGVRTATSLWWACQSWLSSAATSARP